MQPIDRPGKFVAKPYTWKIRKGARTASLGVEITWLLTEERLAGGGVESLSGQMLTALGMVWFVRADGTYSEHGLKQLSEVLGWDGDVEAFDASSGKSLWDPPAAWIELESETYKGVDLIRVRWINEIGDTGGGGVVTPSEAQELASQHNDALKARIAARRGSGQKLPDVTPATGDEIPF